MSFVGQSVVFEESSMLMKKTMGIEVSGMQIRRISKHYGETLNELIDRNCESVLPAKKSSKDKHISYVMMDGAMVFTVDGEWKEMKLGSVFTESQIIDIQTNRRQICDAVYVSHLGNVDDFFPKFERHLVHYQGKVIIGDGARWIWNWAEDNYPGATQILDYYHAKEKLVLFAKEHFTNDEHRKEWLDNQEYKLLHRDNGVHLVIQTLEQLRNKACSAKSKKKALDYYNEHEDRMDYKRYQEKGLLIGSGPIEAAHRSVIQQRMKLSGQKWSIKGANALATLRCYNKSNAWDLVTKVIKAAA